MSIHNNISLSDCEHLNAHYKKERCRECVGWAKRWYEQEGKCVIDAGVSQTTFQP